jgi:maltose alpha-D-glucosyltransferase/alpha-amylase
MFWFWAPIPIDAIPNKPEKSGPPGMERDQVPGRKELILAKKATVTSPFGANPLKDIFLKERTAIGSRTNMFDEQSLQRLERALPGFLQSQRWYRAKAKTIRSVSVEDAVPMQIEGSFAVVIRIAYTDNEHETYLLPLTESGKETDLVAGGFYDALSSPEFRASLLNAIACDRVFTGRAGTVAATRTSAFDRPCAEDAPNLESKVSRAEQSNSSIIFGDKYILKVFRKLEAGINPDIEVGAFLTAQGFAHTPPVLGDVQYRTKGDDVMYAGILQGFVRNHGDAWKYTLDSLRGFFERALQNRAAPIAGDGHPFDLLTEELPALARQTIGEYIESARLLGVRTAQMHAALSSDSANPDFAPEAFTEQYADVLYSEMLHEADRAFALLREKSGSLPGEAAISARTLLENEPAIRERFASPWQRRIRAERIRHHGDYHLGQVLYTGDDFVIIDFEGEPARPLAARRLKTLAMRDVAGMIRSFSYAAFAESGAGLEDWSAFWSTWVSTEFLKGYFEKAQGASFAGSDVVEQRFLFDAFVLQKALYETSYELNNRPDWVHIPLRGILSLIS